MILIFIEFARRDFIDSAWQTVVRHSPVRQSIIIVQAYVDSIEHSIRHMYSRRIQSMIRERERHIQVCNQTSRLSSRL
jgi:hypothetical protein